MSQRLKTNKPKRRRGFTYLWIAGLALLVFLLIYFEQTALLYIVSTLGVTVLLVLVAAADLGSSDLPATGPEQPAAPATAPAGK